MKLCYIAPVKVVGKTTQALANMQMSLFRKSLMKTLSILTSVCSGLSVGSIVVGELFKTSLIPSIPGTMGIVAETTGQVAKMGIRTNLYVAELFCTIFIISVMLKGIFSKESDPNTISEMLKCFAQTILYGIIPVAVTLLFKAYLLGGFSFLF